MSMYNLISTQRPSSSTNDMNKNQPMDMISTVSMDRGSLSLTVVIQPSRKQSLRLSFPGNYPIEQFNGHLRFESEDSVESRERCPFYSQESLGAVSGVSDEHMEGSWEGMSSQFDSRIGSSITLANCYRCPRGLPSDCSMSARNSTESAIDPVFSPRTAIDLTHPSAPGWTTIPSASETISHGHRFYPVSDPVVPTIEIVPSTDLVLRSERKNSTRSLFSSDIIDLFPSPPPCRGSPRFPITQPAGRLDEEVLDDCFAAWLLQDCLIAQQSAAKEAILQSIVTSNNTTMLSRELSIVLDPASPRMASLDFETYHGLRNGMWNLGIYPQMMQMLPTALCRFPSVTGAPIDLCQDPVLSEEEEIEGRKALIKSTKLEEAQMCSVKDERGRKILFKDVIRHRQTFVIFLRFFWCAKCQHYVRSISNYFAPGTEARKKLDDCNSTVVFIGTGSWKMISSYRAMLGCSFEFYTDTTTTSRLYRKMGLHRIIFGGSSDAATLQETLTIWQTMKSSAKSIPKLPLHNPGSFTQLGGEFCFQNLSPDYSAPTAMQPRVQQDSPTKNIVQKFSFGLKSPRTNQENLLVAPRMEELSSDPFRRSFIDVQTEPHLNPLLRVRCIYANRMKSSASHGRFDLLFNPIGVEFPK